jgi:hypothetical protein
MEKKVKKSRLAGIPAWALSILTFFASLGFWVLFGENQFTHLSTTDKVLVIGYLIFTTAACFFICREHPKSVWYTHFICSGLLVILTIMPLLVPGNMPSSVLIIMAGLFLFPVTGAIVGARIGRRRINQANNKKAV